MIYCFRVLRESIFSDIDRIAGIFCGIRVSILRGKVLKPLNTYFNRIRFAGDRLSGVVEYLYAYYARIRNRVKN